MGKKNRQRRAAKAKTRAKARARDRHARQGGQGFDGASHDPGFGPHGPGCGCDHGDLGGLGGRFEQPRERVESERERVEALYGLHQLARRQGDDARADETLTRLTRFRPELVAREIETDLARVIPALWDGGWLPGEVIRQARRGAGAHGERVANHAVAVDHARRDSSTLHPRWQAHVSGLDLPAPARATRWLLDDDLARPGPTSKPVDWAEVARVAISVAHAWSHLGILEQIIPPPGAEAQAAADSIIDLAGQQAEPILAKVRHLLAQAESTNFDAEAEAFTAKAQELMARHAIDAALVWDRQSRPDEPISLRLPIDDPYASAKEMMLTVVAAENGCRAVIDKYHGLVHLVGFDGDLAWVETLFTSLLIQSQRELNRAGATEEAGGRRRGRGFRASFLASYANRIGERLAEINAHVRQAHEDGDTATEGDGLDDSDASSPGALVPILERRASAVDDAVNDLFGDLTTNKFQTGNDRLGWEEGRQAADRADLHRTLPV